MTRRLAAVLAADIAGYSRLVEHDEAGTLAAVRDLLKTLIEPKVQQYNGRLVKLMGDGVLVEFPSAVDAASCAVEIQCALVERNADNPADLQISYRIGINVGDVVVEEEDIFGDGVIIASPLEGLAEPGGICISDNVLSQIEGKLDLTFEALGKRKVKNVSARVVAHRIVLDEKAAALRTDNVTTLAQQNPWYRDYRAALAASVLLALFAATWWQLSIREEEAQQSDRSAVVQATVSVESKPRLAVLPFTNISGDEDQEYFSDGMTEDLITDLSKLANLRITSATTTAKYKGRSADIREIGKSLGVRYVVEGSVRKAGDMVRINAQLTDAISGSHIWAERYDGSLKDIFSLQDQVLEKIAYGCAVSHSCHWLGDGRRSSAAFRSH